MIVIPQFMAFILSLDQGTTSSRAILFDQAGTIHGVAQAEFTQHFPEPGLVEHDANEIWDTQLRTAQQVLADTGTAPTDIAAIGITNQRETTLLWDRATGEPISNAIVWQDRRTAGFCAGLKADGHAEMIQERTGLVLDAYFSGSKVRWMLDNIPKARERAEAGELCFGTMDSWLIYKLTGGRVHVTDESNASRTLLYNIRECAWDESLLDLFQIPDAILPEVRSSSEVYGESEAELLGQGIPIAGIGGDQQAALFGQACHSPGQAKNTYGTGCFMLMHTGTKPIRSENNLLTTIAWQIGGTTEYALEGSVFVAGAAVQWLRDQLGFVQSASEIEALAAEVEDNGGVYLVPAFAGLGAPHWDPYARGALVGLTRGSNKAHIARAALESIAYQTRDVLTAMEADSGIKLTELRVDGGASMNDLLMQFQADLLDVPVVRPAVSETTALGAAYLAGLAVGYWKHRDDIATNWQEAKRFEPAMNDETRGRLVHGWNKAVKAAKGWAE
ncbi:MAG: glycerol kinase [Verrucomicrobiales bacterium]